MPLEEVTPIYIHPDYPNRHIMIGTELIEELRSTLVEFLENNYNISARLHGDVPSIDHLSCHPQAFTDSDHPSVRKKRRKFAPECLKVIKVKVTKLIKANIIREPIT